jgi:Arc/MetJ family transcription regulator
MARSTGDIERLVLDQAIRAASTPAQGRAFLSALRQCLQEAQARHQREGRAKRGINHAFNVQQFVKRT